MGALETPTFEAGGGVVHDDRKIGGFALARPRAFQCTEGCAARNATVDDCWGTNVWQHLGYQRPDVRAGSVVVSVLARARLACEAFDDLVAFLTGEEVLTGSGDGRRSQEPLRFVGSGLAVGREALVLGPAGIAAKDLGERVDHYGTAGEGGGECVGPDRAWTVVSPGVRGGAVIPLELPPPFGLALVGGGWFRLGVEGGCWVGDQAEAAGADCCSRGLCGCSR